MIGIDSGDRMEKERCGWKNDSEWCVKVRNERMEKMRKKIGRERIR